MVIATLAGLDDSPAAAVVLTMAWLSGIHAWFFNAAKRTDPSSKWAEFSRSPHCAAHLPTQLIAFIFLACYGTWAWLYATPAGIGAIARVTQPTLIGARLAQFMTGFQIYEVCAALVEPTGRLAGFHKENLVHHSVSMVAGMVILRYDLAHWHAPFFLGVVEVSSIVLVVIDACRTFACCRSNLPTLKTISENLFGVLFISIRIPYFIFRTARFTRDVLAVRASADALVPDGVLVGTLAINYVIAALQFYWAAIIASALYEKFAHGGDATTTGDSLTGADKSKKKE